MSVRNEARRILASLSLVLVLLGWSTVGWAGHEGGHETGNGGHSIEIGGAQKVFDVVEYSDPFVPDQAGPAWTRVSEQLDALATKLPYTAAYLRSFYVDGKTVWWFVNVKLRDTQDAGESNTLLTYKREQIAANKDGVIQIRKDLWDQLDVESKATLLMHEMLWSAVGPSCVKDGSSIRLLARYLLHPSLKHFSAVNVSEFLLKIVRDPNCPLARWVSYDKARGAEPQSFEIREIQTQLQHDRAIVVLRGRYRNMWVTTTRPNASFRDVTVRRNSMGGFSPASPPDGQQICGTLSYAGVTGWRLPTWDELVELKNLGLFSLTDVSGRVVMGNFGDNTGLKVTLVYPSTFTIQPGETDFEVLQAPWLTSIDFVPYLCVRR